MCVVLSMVSKSLINVAAQHEFVWMEPQVELTGEEAESLRLC